MSDIQKDTRKDITKKTDLDLRSKFNIFFKNEHHSFAVLKAEKLASALYMVTGFVSDNDPLRTRLRTCALEVVSCVTDSEQERKGDNNQQFGARCLEIGSMLSMAERAGLISPMNSRILCEEYASLGSFIQTHHEHVFGGTINLDSEPMPMPSRSAHVQEQKSISQRRPISKKTPNYKRHENRRQIILSLLNKKDKINVKDASTAIPGCSEKTIQRELTAMVDDGVLYKEGERRWSVYKKAL